MLSKSGRRDDRAGVYRPARAANVAHRMAPALCLLLIACGGATTDGATDTPGNVATPVAADGQGAGRAARGTAVGERAAGATTAPANPTIDRTVERIVTADGALEPPVPPVQLAFQTTGTVLEVSAAPGGPVSEGEVLARVEADALERELLDARTAVATAREGLAGARLALARLERGAEVETSRLDVERAKNQRWAQQVQRDAICGRAGDVFTPQSECDAAQANVQAAEQTVAIAQEAYQSTLDLRDEELAAARERVASAQAALEQAQDAVSRAEERQSLAEVTAPFDGAVESVVAAEGMEVAPGTPAMTVVRTEPLLFVTNNLGERYVADVQRGALAEVTLTTWPDRTVSGEVLRIAPSGDLDPGGAVIYRVWIGLDAHDLPIRAGMTGRVEIAVGP